ARHRGGLPVIAIIGLALGLVLGVVVQPDVPALLQPYLPIAVVAALDTLAGGLRASLDGAFDSHVFITSFLFNVLIAAFLVFLGDQLGVGSQLSTAVIVVLGIRIFSNAAAIRRLLFGHERRHPHTLLDGAAAAGVAAPGRHPASAGLARAGDRGPAVPAAGPVDRRLGARQRGLARGHQSAGAGAAAGRGRAAQRGPRGRAP